MSSSEPAPADVAAQMRRRLRTYFAMVFGGLAALVALIVLAGVVGHLAFGDDKGAGRAISVVGGAGFLGYMAFAWWSVFHYLRCPACSRLVAMQVSWQYSILSGLASPECRGCGALLFDSAGSRRFRRVLFFVMGIAFALGVVGAVLSMSMRKHHAAPAPVAHHEGAAPAPDATP